MGISDKKASQIKVLFVASECTPIAKVGGLGDVIGSLPKALSKIGVDARIIIPFYEEIDRKRWKLSLVISNFQFPRLHRGFGGIDVYKTRLPRSTPAAAEALSGKRNDPLTVLRIKKEVEVFLIYNKKYLSRGPIYFEKTAFVGSKKEIDRFLFFSQAVYQLLKHPDFWRPDVVHCNDWHSGFLAKLLKSKEIATPNTALTRQSGVGLAMTRTGRPKAVFTIHNLANQGRWRRRNLMAEGIKYTDKITTVSPTYAKEILTREYGEGLEKLLKKRKRDLVGILNGVDYSFWPDGAIRKAPSLRQRLRRARQGKFWHAMPKFGFVARLTYQKGLDLLLPLIPALVEKENAEFYFLGQGQEKYEHRLLALASKYPKKVRVKIGFDEKLAHKIYAESDFFLMPSLFEPSGLGQMISMHYGVIPIVRATGGLQDSVQHLKTGFVFEKKTPAALLGAIKMALRYFHSPQKLEIMRRNCLVQNFSWTKSAQEYKKLYKELMLSNR